MRRTMRGYVTKSLSFILRSKWKALCFLSLFCLFIIHITWNSQLSQLNSSFSENNFESPFSTPFKAQVIKCTMDNCFDSSRCSQFKVYVYPDDPNSPKISTNYQKILSAIRRSPFYTDKPEEACIFVPSLDTLDRDPRSDHYITDLHKRINQLPFWSSQPTTIRRAPQYQPGMNHLLFILFSGTWPYYDVDELNMDVGSAMLARASSSKVRMRQNFDISFPLVTANYPDAGQIPRYSPPPDARVHLKFMASFKGKRYVVGIGSETRNSLYHIHNGKDIIIATTCKHMDNWNLYADSRCPIDNAYYETVSYEELLHNSTFCLVPRGRRLGSFRFLEVLEAGCIPVILANDWELPFAEVIDWSQIAILAYEQTLSRLPVLLRNIPESRIIQMRERVRFIWNSYFRSVDAIVHATLLSIRDRLTLQRRNYELWNRSPGRILFVESTNIEGCSYPSSDLPVRCQKYIDRGFTLLVTIRQPFCSDYLDRLKKLASMFTKSLRLKKVVLVWQCNFPPPLSEKTISVQIYNDLPVELSFAPPPLKSTESSTYSIPSPSNRFRPTSKQIHTLAVWSVELDVADTITLPQVEAAYDLWLQFPHKLIGFTPRTHVWSNVEKIWSYSINVTSQGNFSMVLLNAAVYHRYYQTLYWKLTTESMRETVDTMATGEDILFNCVVGYASQSAPLLLSTSKKTSQSSNFPPSELTNYMGIPEFGTNQTQPKVEPDEVLAYRHTCLRAFSNAFQPLHLLASFADPDNGKHFGLANSMQYPFLPLYYSNLRFVTPEA
nr:exostosin 1 [Hymenolepis microstoma]